MPVKRLAPGEAEVGRYGVRDGDEPELLSLVCERGAGVYCLHPQDLVIALLVVEHGRREVVEHVVRGERPIGLCDDAFSDDENARSAVYAPGSIRAR